MGKEESDVGEPGQQTSKLGQVLMVPGEKHYNLRSAAGRRAESP